MTAADDLTGRLAAALTAALGALAADPAGRYHTSGYIPGDVVDGWRALLAEHACPCLPGAPTHRHGEGGYATEQPGWDHQIVFAADGTWTIDTRHPEPCPAARPCLVERLAQAQVPSPAYHGLRGRFWCAVNDLGDRFLIGDRVTDGSACCVSEPASDDTTMTAPTTPDPAHTGPAEAACDTPKGSSDVTGMTTPGSTPTEHDHTTGFPTFPADAELVVATSDGAERRTGAQWNAHVTAAAKAGNGVLERLMSCPPLTCTTSCPAREG